MQHGNSAVGKSCKSAGFLPVVILKCAATAWAVCAWTPGATGQDSPSSAGSLSGTVFLDADNRPASQVVVNLRSDAQQIFRSVLTDYDGHFEVGGLPEGAYEIVMEEPGCEPERISAKVGGVLSKVAVALRLRRYKGSQSQQNNFSVSVRQLKMPGRARDEYQKGLERIANNDPSDGLRHFTKATEAFSGYYEAFYQMGVAEMKLGQFEKATAAFQRSIDLSEGRFALPVFGMAYTSYLQGKFTEAEAILRRGLDLDGGVRDGYFYLGMTLFQMNRQEEAEKSAQEALLRWPDFAPAYVVLANVYGRRRELREQVQAYEAYLRLSPNGPYAERMRQARQVTLGIMASLQPVN